MEPAVILYTLISNSYRRLGHAVTPCCYTLGIAALMTASYSADEITEPIRRWIKTTTPGKRPYCFPIEKETNQTGLQNARRRLALPVDWARCEQRSPLAHRQDPNTTIQGVCFIRYHSSEQTEHCIIH